MFMLVFSMAIAAPLWVDPLHAFAGTDRAYLTLRNPTTAHAILIIDGTQVGEIPPRGTLQLSLPLGTAQVAWRTPDGHTHVVPQQEVAP